MVGYNVTSSKLSSMASVCPADGLLITLVLFISAIIFLLSKNFRQFIYGAVVSGVLILNYKFSRWIVVSAVENNFEPLKWVGYISGFIIVSIVIGRSLQKLKIVKKLEKALTEK